MFTEDERKQALADYLGVSFDEIKNGSDDNLFETEDGEEYYVVDEDEATELAKEDIELLYDDIGLESFTPVFKDWIYDNAIDEDWFEDWFLNDYKSYAEEIRDEDSDDFASRLIEEMYEAGILTDDDFEIDDNGDTDYMTLKDDIEVDDKIDDFAQKLTDDIDDYAHEFEFQLGKDALKNVVDEHNLVDLDKVIDRCIDIDGLAHFIAHYDGEEIDLDDGLFAYRVY